MRFLILLLFLVVPAVVNAQDSEASKESVSTFIYVPFVCNVGDCFDYEVTENKYSKGILESKVTRLLKLEVLSSSDEEVVLAMKLVAQLDAATRKQVESDPLSKATLEAWDALVIKVGIAPNGVFQDVKNLSEVQQAADKTRQTIRGILDTMKKELTSDSKMTPDDLDRVYDSINKRFGSTQAIVQKVMAPLNLIMQLVETELDSEKHTVEQTLADIGVASGLPATETYRVVEVDKKANQVVFQHQRVIEGDEAVKASMQAMMDEIKPDRKKEEAQAKVTVLAETTTTATLDLAKGWPESVVWENKFNNFKDDQVPLQMRLEIRRVDADK